MNPSRNIGLVAALVRLWNDLVPIGTPVIYTDDAGRQRPTETTSEAFANPGGAPFIKVALFLAPVSLMRVAVDTERLMDTPLPIAVTREGEA